MFDYVFQAVADLGAEEMEEEVAAEEVEVVSVEGAVEISVVGKERR